METLPQKQGVLFASASATVVSTLISATNSTLTTLNLWNNEVGNKGAVRLAEALTTN